MGGSSVGAFPETFVVDELDSVEDFGEGIVEQEQFERTLKE
jgi:hypothetical protein